MNNLAFSETLRRSGLLIAIPVGALLITWSAPELIELRMVDWERRRRNEIASFLSDEARRDLNVYIAEETRSAVMDLPNGRWSVFFAEAIDTLEGRPPDAKWAFAMRGEKYSSIGVVVYFSTQDTRLHDWLDRPEMSRGYLYLRLQGDVSPPRIQARRVSSHLARSAPIGLSHPYKNLGWWIILFGFIVYAMVPWPRRSTNQFLPMTPFNAALADVVGYVLWGGFIGIWAALIQARNLPGHGEWTQIVVLTAVFWGMALCGAAILAIVVWYMSFQLTWDEEGICVSTFWKSRRFKWRDVERLAMKPIVYSFAEWIRLFGWLLLFFRLRAAGPVLAMQTRSQGLYLETKQCSYGIDVSNLSPYGLNELADACRSHNIPFQDAS